MIGGEIANVVGAAGRVDGCGTCVWVLEEEEGSDKDEATAKVASQAPEDECNLLVLPNGANLLQQVEEHSFSVGTRVSGLFIGRGF
jgi:hypothetical protein